MNADLIVQICFTLIGLIFIGPIYFAPTIIGLKKGKNVWLIAPINFFLGWTMIGFVLAMALAIDDRH